MPLQSWTTPAREKKTTPCHAGTTPTPSLRRGVVKPLGEHNRALNSHSPALSSLKRTPAHAQKTMLTGVDLTRRFASSTHGSPTTTSRGPADFRSPRGSPSLDRIHEGCSSSLGRERKGSGTTTLKSRLRGGVHDTPTVKKAITFSTPFGKESVGGKHDKGGQRKDLSAHFTLEVKKDVTLASKEPNAMQPKLHLEYASKLSLSRDLPMAKGVELRGRDAAEAVAAARSSMRDKMATGVGHRSFGAREGRLFAKDAPCRLAFDAIELSPSQGCCSTALRAPTNSGLDVWQNDRRSGAATSSPQDNSDMSNKCEDDESDAEVMVSPLPCKSPEVCSRGFFAMDESGQEEWIRSQDNMACFKDSTTPEAQPSKSPELIRRAMAMAAPPPEVAFVANPQQQQQQQQTPSPQPTSSPEFLKRGSVPPSSGGCFGAGPLMGPEGMRSVKDRRKCKPRGILTIEGEFLFSSGSADFLVDDDETVSVQETTISVPALASVEWMVADVVDASVSLRDVDASMSFSHLPELGDVDPESPAIRGCRSAVVDASGPDQVFWKKGLLYEWSLSLSDQKRAEETPSPQSYADLSY